MFHVEQMDGAAPVFDAATLFQRTSSGLEEIRNKTHALTQSERLVLILIDGVTSCDGLRQKLKGLAEGRFERALYVLLSRGLVQQIDCPIVESRLNEQLIDCFLWQDTLDPVTVGPFVQDKDMGEIETAKQESPILRPPGITRVDIYLPLEPQKNAPPVDARIEQRPYPAANPLLNDHARHTREKQSGQNELPQWMYWAFFGGFVLTILFVVVASSP